MAADTTSLTPARRTTRTPDRDPWFDNAKMALVLLVVVGHAWTLLPHGALEDHLYAFLYVWHVPAFVFVTGYLSRSFAWTRIRLWQLVRTVAVPYVLFEALMALFRVRDPHWPMWYLSALFFWRLLAPAFRAVPQSVAIGGAVAISVGGGFWAGTTFDLLRICGFLPFFVLGLAATPDRLERLRTDTARRGALWVFAGIALLTTWVGAIPGGGGKDWLYYSYGYASLGLGGLHAVALRLGLLLLGGLGALGFLALVPRVSGWFTRMGAATLVVYLFHGFVVKTASYAGYPGWAAGHPLVALVLTTAGAAGLALLLAWAPVGRRLADLVDPFGYAERHLRHAVHLNQAAAAEPELIAAR